MHVQRDADAQPTSNVHQEFNTHVWHNQPDGYKYAQTHRKLHVAKQTPPSKHADTNTRARINDAAHSVRLHANIRTHTHTGHNHDHTRI